MQVCRVWAQVVFEVVRSSVPHLQASFMLTAPAQDRKRQLGSNLPWKGRRQFAAGGQRLYQPNAVPPSLYSTSSVSLVRPSSLAMNIVHPFTVQPPLPNKILENIKLIVSDGSTQ